MKSGLTIVSRASEPQLPHAKRKSVTKQKQRQSLPVVQHSDEAAPLRFRQAKPGDVFLVECYHTGDFVGRLIQTDLWNMLTFEVVDPLRPVPRDVCPFPTCGLELDHDGDHAPGPVIRAGSVVQVLRAHVMLTASARPARRAHA